MTQMNNENGTFERSASKVREATACNKSRVWGWVQEGMGISQASSSPQPLSLLITTTHSNDPSQWPLACTWLAPQQEPFKKQAAHIIKAAVLVSFSFYYDKITWPAPCLQPWIHPPPPPNLTPENTHLKSRAYFSLQLQVKVYYCRIRGSGNLKYPRTAERSNARLLTRLHLSTLTQFRLPTRGMALSTSRSDLST